MWRYIPEVAPPSKSYHWCYWTWGNCSSSHCFYWTWGYHQYTSANRNSYYCQGGRGDLVWGGSQLMLQCSVCRAKSFSRYLVRYKSRGYQEPPDLALPQGLFGRLWSLSRFSQREITCEGSMLQWIQIMLFWWVWPVTFFIHHCHFGR